VLGFSDESKRAKRGDGGPFAMRDVWRGGTATFTAYGNMLVTLCQGKCLL